MSFDHRSPPTSPRTVPSSSRRYLADDEDMNGFPPVSANYAQRSGGSDYPRRDIAVPVLPPELPPRPGTFARSYTESHTTHGQHTSATQRCVSMESGVFGKVLQEQQEAVDARHSVTTKPYPSSTAAYSDVYYHEKPLPITPNDKEGIAEPTGFFAPFIRCYRQNRTAAHFLALLLIINLSLVTIFSVLGRLGIGQGTLNGDAYGLGASDTGFAGLPMNGEGDGTYYDPGVGISSCEWNYTNDDMVAALNAPQFGSFARPANSPVCGACIKVTGPKGSVRVKIIDKCPVCKRGDVDLSEAAFVKIADKEQGRVPITWHGC